MTHKRQELSATECEQELEKLDLLPKREGRKRADDLLRTMLNSPPDPYTTKPKRKRRAKK